MSEQSTTAVACANIALIKYWGNRDDTLRLPANGSISMNLEGLFTRTTVTWREEELALSAAKGGAWKEGNEEDSLIINGLPVRGTAFQRVSDFLDLVRNMAGMEWRAEVVSENNFPAGTGIASSASAFAALALAASIAAGLDLEPAALSRLARRGSGSACRSIPGGFVEWQAGIGDEDSFATSIASPEHWELADCIAVVSAKQKPTGSTEGHSMADTSPLQAGRVADAPRRLDLCRRALLERDFDALAGIVELDSNLMHSVMMTSMPPLFYWQEPTLTLMRLVREWRFGGLPVCYSIDAGPNVHVITEGAAAGRVADLLGAVPGVQKVLVALGGGQARLVK